MMQTHTRRKPFKTRQAWMEEKAKELNQKMMEQLERQRKHTRTAYLKKKSKKNGQEEI